MGIVLLNLIGQCGPFLGTNVFPTKDGPRYIKGQSICAAFMFFTAFLALLLRMILVWENKKLDQKYGTREEREAQGVDDEKNPQNYAEDNYGPSYRYFL